MKVKHCKRKKKKESDAVDNIMKQPQKYVNKLLKFDVFCLTQLKLIHRTMNMHIQRNCSRLQNIFFKS